MNKFKNHQIKYMSFARSKVHRRTFAAIVYSWQKLKWKMHSIVQDRKSQENSKPIKYQRNCVRNSLFYDSSISIEYTYTSTLPIRKRLHSLSLIFQLYDLVLCAQTSANVCCYCYCRVPATAVFVAVISFNNEC